MSDPFSVLLTSIERPKIARIGKVIAEFRRMPVQDAIQLIKPRWGIIEETTDQNDAEALSRLLNSAGEPAEAMPSAHVSGNQKPSSVQSARITTKGLEVAAKQDWQIVPWDAIALFAAALFRNKTSRVLTGQQGPSMAEKLVKTGILLTTGLPIPLKRKRATLTRVEETEIRYFLDVFLYKSTLRIRIDAQAIDYTFLKEKMEMSSQTNFRIFLKELVSGAPRAVQNEGFRGLTAEKPGALEGYENDSDFDQECRWLTTLISMKKKK